MKTILLSQGKEAVVDDEDYDVLSRFKWSTLKTRDAIGYYATTSCSRVYMHRLILWAKKEDEVDHINGNGLDNRRCNLRIVTASQNRINRGKTKKNTSGYKGVYAHGLRWKVCIAVEGRSKHIGVYDTKDEAALVYNHVASELFGEYARLNEIREV